MMTALVPTQTPFGELDTIRALMHDLRQPIAAILALADGETDDRRLTIIRSEADWLASLVGSVLGDGESDAPREVDMAELAGRVVDIAAPTAECSIELVVPPDQTHARVRAIACSRALSSLLDNAVRAAGPAGHVRVDVSSRGGVVRVGVTDDGPGFGRIPARTSLGLVTTRAMVASCGGSLHLGPAPGQGTVAEILVRQACDDRGAW